MAVTINASTTSGLVQTADTSGNINLQSNGSTVLAMTSTGVTITGTLSATSTSIVTPSSATTWTAPQRGSITDNSSSLSFNMNLTNNFKCTPVATGTLTFTNITAGQSGYILLSNTSGYAITAAATTKVGTTFLATISTAGTYLISYFTDGTNVYCTASGALA